MSRLDPQEARQGRKGTPVLRILVAALVLVVIAGLGVWIFGATQPGQNVPSAAQGGDVGAPSSTTTPQGGNTTVQPQTSGPSSSGDTAK